MQKTYPNDPHYTVDCEIIGEIHVCEPVTGRVPVNASRALVGLYADIVVVNEAARYSYLEVVGAQLDRLAFLAVVRARRALELGQKRRRQRNRRRCGEDDGTGAAGGRCTGCRRGRVARQHARSTCTVTPTARSALTYKSVFSYDVRRTSCHFSAAQPTAIDRYLHIYHSSKARAGAERRTDKTDGRPTNAYTLLLGSRRPIR